MADKQPLDRRGFLRTVLGRGAAVAAGAAAGSALLADPAGAADNDTILIGSANDAHNTGTTTTTLTGSQLNVVNGNGGISVRTQANSGSGVQVAPDANTVPMPPAAGSWVRGSMRVDDPTPAAPTPVSDLWYCYQNGSGAAAGWYPISAIPAFVPLPSPVRIYDSRPGANPTGTTKGVLAPNVQRDINVTVNGSGVPLTGFGISLNLAVTSTAGSGFLSVFETGTTWPGNANINWFGDNQNLSNAVFTIYDAAGNFTVRCGGTGPTHFVIDAIGFYTLTA
jgi:hypothetical protein